MLTPSTSRNIHVVLLDQRVLVRTAVRSLLEQQAHLTVIGEASPGPHAVALVAQRQPDIILLTLLPQQTKTLELIPALLDATAQARLLIIVEPWDVDQPQQAVQRGAMGVVRTDQPATTLLTAISKVYHGELWVSRRLTAQILTDRVQFRRSQAADPEATKIAQLTNQERAVIALLGGGLRNRQIAQRLSITEATVRRHLTSIFRKLGVTDRIGLVVYAYRYGLAEIPSPSQQHPNV